jgi:hypothetical protein
MKTHHQELKELNLEHLVFVTPLLLPAAIAAGSSNGVTNTRCCSDFYHVRLTLHILYVDYIQCTSIYKYTHIIVYTYIMYQPNIIKETLQLCK